MSIQLKVKDVHHQRLATANQSLGSSYCRDWVQMNRILLR